MFTTKHDLIRAKAGEAVEITFTVKDKNGDPVDVSGGTAVYKLGKLKETALISLSSSPGITLSSNTCVVKFNTSTVQESGQQALGKFTGQLKITLSGDPLIVGEGTVEIEPVVL